MATGTWNAAAISVAKGGTGATDATAARTNLGVRIGTDVQGYNSTLAAVAGGTYTGDDSITTVGTIGTGTWNAVAISVAKGGTGATNNVTARTNLGVRIGTDVQAYSAVLGSVAAGTYTGSTSITTVGTIGTGTWNAVAISVAKGGTGATDAATARSNLGLSSTTFYNLLKTTTDGTADVILTTNGNSPSGTTNLVVVSASSVWMFTVNIAAYNTTDNAMGAFQIRGAISRNANNATSIVGSTIKEYFLDSNMTNISASVTADDSNETIQVKVKGLSSKTIKWTASIAIEEISTA